MAAIPTTTVRIDPEVKEQANEVFEELGLSLSAAINVFLKAVVREGGMPFDMRVADRVWPDAGSRPHPEDALPTAAADGR